ncbi:MAG: P-loop NTPase fold protein, partial [Acidobacteriota bacterium]|nr:P-loop NTPase fold protein [Acidobacteriota bacterium]
MKDELPRQSIYLSYAAENEDDAAFGHRLFAALEDNDKEVTSFSPRTGLVQLEAREKLRAANEEYREAARQSIRAADVVLFVLSPSSLSSEFCEMERWYVRELNKASLAIYFRTVPKGEFPLEFGQTRIDFRADQDFDSSLRHLLTVLEHMSRTKPTTDATETTKPLRESETTKPLRESEFFSGKVGIKPPGEVGLGEIKSTLALAVLLERAKQINEVKVIYGDSESLDVSFSVLLIAFLLSDDPLSVWFQNFAAQYETSVGVLYKKAKISRDHIESFLSAPVEENELALIYQVTSSTDALLRKASEFLGKVSGAAVPEPELDVRHLMAAYIYDPAGHEDDVNNIGIKPHEWSNSFLGWIKSHHPEELAAWKKIHREKFPNNPPLIIDEGPSTHIATDRWTTEDSLGYAAYAHAICRFMTHRETRAPLTISIQAPWGGGKTSLMRMIQKELDPRAAADVDEEAEQPRGRLTIGEVLREVGKWIESNTQEKLPKVKPGESQVLTVWFNAWKYESVNQVWAGLVDAIMRQVAARLDLIEREQFWLRLNLKRIDADRLRQRIHDRIFNTWRRAMRKVAFAAGAFFAAALVVMIGGWNIDLLRFVGLGGAALSVVVSALVGLIKFLRTKERVEKEPAAVSLSEYLDIPDYNAELGFIHRVEADLRRVLASVPRRRREGGEGEQNLRIVVFIDDLDRCSPTKVAQVVEAVNLFLAGDFKDCMFVLGMDAEMVAAALQAAHKDVIACLPTDAGIPVGWRFMDKFVQLPFLIPPTE